MDQQLQETVQGLVEHAKRSHASSESIASSLSRVEDLIVGSNDPPQYSPRHPDSPTKQPPYYKRLYSENYESEDSLVNLMMHRRSPSGQVRDAADDDSDGQVVSHLPF